MPAQEAHVLAPLLSNAASTPRIDAVSPGSTPALAPDKYQDGDDAHGDEDDGWEAERPPLRRDWLDDDGGARGVLARIPFARSIASWRPDARRVRALVLLTVCASTLLAVFSAAAGAGPASPLATTSAAPTGSGWRSTLSSAASGAAGWLWGSGGDQRWTRPMHVERNETVSLGEYLHNISFVPFPLPASTSFVHPDASTYPLPHPSYTTIDERNAVLVTMCNARYVHAVRVWTHRAGDLGLPMDNVVIICIDDACLDEAEKHGIRAYGGFRQEVYESRVPAAGHGNKVTDLPPLEKREGPNGGLERGQFMQYIKFRVLYELNAAGFASLFFEADTAMTQNPFNWMRPFTPDRYGDALEVAPELLSVDERRRLPSPFALSAALDASSSSSAANASSFALVDPEGLDPGWDMVMTQDGWHIANFGWFMMRPTRATVVFWRTTLEQYVARGGWDQGTVTQSIQWHGWSTQWIRGWWETGNETLPEVPETMEAKNKMEQWHFVNQMDGLKEGERLRIAMLPVHKFFAYHFWGLGWWYPPQDLPDPIVHHMTQINYQMRNFWPKERGWYTDLDGYYTRPRPVLVSWNATYEPGLFPSTNYTSSDPTIPRTFFTHDEPDFPASTLTGTVPDLLHYTRILQLLGAVSAKEPEPLLAPYPELADDEEPQLGTGGAKVGSNDTFSVMLPGKVRAMDDKGKTIEQETTRLIDLDTAVHASLDVLEPAFFNHSARHLPTSSLRAWNTTRLRVPLASFDSLPSLVTHLRDLLAPYVGAPETGFPSRGVVVELEGWEATREWKLDALEVEERAEKVSAQDFEALKSVRSCEKWWQLERIPGGWCKPEELPPSP
ncbi:hypothetical protein JCM10450v2_007686 [Rhodotorula kratochvilovae]